MQKLLSVPLLPQNKVCSVAVGAEYKNIIYALNKLDVDCFEIQKNAKLDVPISSHADCMLVQLNEHTFAVEQSISQDFSQFIKSKTVESIDIISENVFSPYPNDVKLNIKVFDNKILSNQKFLSKKVIDFAEKNDFKIINTKQGYSACSTVLLNKSSIITDDESVYNTVIDNGLFCEKIEKGSVILNGYDYGFIGGCCGFIDKNTLAFTGKLSSHKDCDKIENILLRNSIKYIELTNDELIDIGGIIPLTEKINNET